jgi:hypothetical protein
MKEEFVPYELALKLKELGFDEECFSYYHNRHEPSWVKTLHRGDTTKNSVQNLYQSDCSAPIFQQAFRWFREEHDLHYQLVPFFSDKESHAVDYYLAIAQHRPPIQVNTFEEAELACLDKLIKILETKQQEQ